MTTITQTYRIGNDSITVEVESEFYSEAGLKDKVRAMAYASKKENFVSNLNADALIDSASLKAA